MVPFVKRALAFLFVVALLSTRLSVSSCFWNFPLSGFSTARYFPRPHGAQLLRRASRSTFDGDNVGGFDWWNQWYPVSPVGDLPVDKPSRITLLGRDLVVWRDASATWRCFHDECPHRLAPLSEGRIDSNGRLQCAYHGWEFDAAGHCQRIPQIPVGEDSRAALKNAACVRALLTKQVQGLLWVFPGEQHKADAVEPALIPEIDSVQHVDTTQAYVRDVPYSWDTLVENLADPSHVPFSHHGIIQNRDTAVPIPLKVSEVQADGWEAVQEPLGQYSSWNLQWRPPCLLYYKLERPKIFLGLGTYCVPTAPGRARLITRFPFRFPTPLITRLVKLQPRWLNHMSQNLVLDSDVVFLHMQERKLKVDADPSAWQSRFYLPADADRGVVAFRQWLQDFAGGQPAWAPECTSRVLPIELPRHELLDRRRQHTDLCKSCRTALGRLEQLSVALKVGAFGLLAVAAYSRGTALKTFSVGGACVLGVSLLGVTQLRQRLVYGNWPSRKWLEA